MVIIYLGMTETEMMEVLHVILETTCVLISRIFFQIPLNMLPPPKFLSQNPKVKPIAILILYRPLNANDFLDKLQTIFSKLTTKLMKFIFSETLI